MREIVSVLGLPDKPMEVNVPKDLVCNVPFTGRVTAILIYPSS